MPFDAPFSAQTQKDLPTKKIRSTETLEMAIKFLFFCGQLHIVEYLYNGTKTRNTRAAILVKIVSRGLNGLDGMANALTERRYQLQHHSVQHSQRTSQDYTAMFSVLLVSRVDTTGFIT